jgi:hypothetical protein
MKKKIKYTNEPMENVSAVSDFLALSGSTDIQTGNGKDYNHFIKKQCGIF